MHINQVNIIHYHNLKYSKLFTDTFNDVSYGDAVMTLVLPEFLVYELKDIDSNKYKKLIEGNIFIALEG